MFPLPGREYNKTNLCYYILGVLVISHDVSFLSGFCNTLWSITRDKSIKVDVSTEDIPFTDILDEYISSL